MSTQPTIKRNPADSMVSTWRHDRSQWNSSHWMIELLGLHLIDFDAEVPVFSKKDKIPTIREWTVHLWILLHAAIPLALHHAYTAYTGLNMHPVAALALYSSAFKLNGIHEMHIMRRLGQVYGFLDGDKHPRDEIPDVGVGKAIRELISTSTLRMVMAVFLTYRAGKTPASLEWKWLPLEIGLYSLTVDFWFYWYHRMMHSVGPLWKLHRRHHLTKHPNPLLSAYADHEQEFMDITGIPLLAYTTLKIIGLPMGFYGWWICFQYIAFSEFIGHSGLRLHGGAPSTVNWLLELFDAELVIEDHDLHHRYGWRKSHNYGKQTRLWDRIFGTCHERIESVKENVDYTSRVTMPLI
ncbi:Fatty acid hydroxylase [Penicillium cf. griseofulvum]|uniref:Fatty acid hydroxylase n=1 Tax=Penicillium cf. griseofulvum TaxID=2972120 RepID=A0A9W9MTS4_9EURO|nr:Fatty acid hydroxylase [Penicillium cf. griseofulvum]KAJ5446063.1 Fatty acid hydroxylase [Penicillium cf. griseofulvum]KAJ5447803.1 Fatty acid hydroxylase [Penicillium cf. griseofulvum]